jgi:glycosyltransferase involved in cell wall biosynthesis
VTPLVSVVIPTYNRAADLKRALTSVLRQTWQHWEVLVVDNHSTDNVAEVIGHFQDPRIRMLSVHNHGVIAVSRNLGVKNAHGEFVAFLDSDDWWAPRKLERSMQELGAGADIVYHDLYLARSNRNGWRLRRVVTRPLWSPALRCLIARGNVLTNSSVVVRRCLLLDIGGLSEDPALVSWEDYECWLRLAAVTEKFRRLTEPLGWYWAGGGNMSSPQRTIRNLERIREMYFGGAGCPDDQELPGWYHYGMGRARFHLREYPEAWLHMKRAMRGDLYPNVRAKALLTLGESMMYRTMWLRNHDDTSASG